MHRCAILLLSYSLLILWGIIVIGISQSIVLLWHDFRQYDDTQSDHDEEIRLTKPQDLQSAHNQSGVQQASDNDGNNNLLGLTPRPSQPATEELSPPIQYKTGDLAGNIPPRPRVLSAASQNDDVAHEISAAFKEANLPIEEQKTRPDRSRSSHAAMGLQIYSLPKAAPTYEPLSIRSSTQPTRASSLYAHPRLVPEQLAPEKNFVEDEKPIASDPFETNPITDEEEDDSTLLFDTSDNKEDNLTNEHETKVTFHLTVGIGLDPGLTRKHRPNEDSLSALQGIRTTPKGPMPTGLFVVADGMGGHANGREASRLAVREVNNVIVPILFNNDANETVDTDDDQEVMLNMLKDGVHRANLAIHEHNCEMLNMMGTTITAALIVNTTAYVVNVGDSRTYLYRPSEGLVQITHDHSVVARFAEHGIIKPEEIYTHPQRNQIYRCLGEHSTIEIDSFLVPLEANDVLLLCSDGLWEMVRDPLIEKIISTSAHQPSQTSNHLIEAALQHGGADNISVIVISIAQITD